MTNYFATLVELMDKDFVSTADYARIRRLAKIVARERNCSVEDVLEAAR
jgi:hypothetical protein